jgi:hypothetical protein
MNVTTRHAIGPFRVRTGLRLLTAVCGIAVASAAFAQQEKPNVVLMLADNVGWGDIGAFAGGELRGMPTPAIDRLAAEGMQLSQFMVEPACTPSRAALMTGRYSTRVGLNTVIIGGTPNTLLASEVTLAELLQKQGLRDSLRRKMASWSRRAKLADPSGVRRIPCRRHRNLGRDALSRKHGTQRDAGGFR